MTILDAARGRLDFGAVVRRTFGVLRRNARGLGLLGLVVYGLPAILFLGVRYVTGLPLVPDLSAAFTGSQLILSAAGYIVTIVTWALMQVVVARATVADLNGHSFSISESMRETPRRILPLIGMTLLIGVAVFVGFMFLMVPGLILLTIWVVAGPALIIEKRGILASLQRSRDLTRNHRWVAFGLIFVFIVAYYASALALGALAFGAMASLNTGGFLLLSIPSTILSVVIVVVASVGSTVIYYDLRVSKEGVAPDQLASVFD